MIIIKNGALVTPEGLRRADLAMDGDKIVRIAAEIKPGEDDIVQDATGCWVFPGFIDGHTHMQCWTGMDWTADSFETGTRAAACGGTTTIVDYATADRGVTLPDALTEWHHRADGTCTSNYAFHMALAEWNDRNRADLSAMREAGVSSFKTYFAYDHLRLDDAETLEVLEELKRIGGILCVHCENGTLVNALQKRVFEQGIHGRGPCAQPSGRVRGRGRKPSAVSGAPAGDAPVNVVHLSTKLGLEAIRAAKARGQKNIYVETCPQYLMLDDTCYLEQGEDGFAGAKYVMSRRFATQATVLRCVRRLWPARSIPSPPTTAALTCTGKRTVDMTISVRFPTARPAWSIAPLRSPRALRGSWAPRTCAA